MQIQIIYNNQAGCWIIGFIPSTTYSSPPLNYFLTGQYVMQQQNMRYYEMQFFCQLKSFRRESTVCWTGLQVTLWSGKSKLKKSKSNDEHLCEL